MTESLRKKLSERIDAQIMAAVMGTANVAPVPQPPLTIDNIRKALAGMPPRETWLSSRLFSDTNAIVVEGSGERFTCAGPGFWMKLQDTVRRTTTPAPEHVGNPLGMNLTPIEIDAWPEDAPDTAEWRRAHWDRLRDAFEVALVPLPDWLRAAPKFSEHG